ncbi:MAG: hypothetical protein ACE5IW_04530 [bacterium]
MNSNQKSTLSRYFQFEILTKYASYKNRRLNDKSQDKRQADDVILTEPTYSLGVEAKTKSWLANLWQDLREAVGADCLLANFNFILHIETST